MALFVDLVALSNGLHGSVQMDLVALFSWIGWLRHHGIFKKNIILYYQSLLQNNVYEDIPLIQNFILDYYTETNNKDMMIKILIDIKSFNDKDLTLKSSTLFTTSQS